jgi:hypothetical protein
VSGVLLRHPESWHPAAARRASERDVQRHCRAWGACGHRRRPDLGTEAEAAAAGFGRDRNAGVHDRGYRRGCSRHGRCRIRSGVLARCTLACRAPVRGVPRPTRVSDWLALAAKPGRRARAGGECVPCELS